MYADAKANEPVPNKSKWYCIPGNDRLISIPRKLIASMTRLYWRNGDNDDTDDDKLDDTSSNDSLSDVGKRSVEVITKSAMRMKEFAISLLEFSKIGTNKERSITSIIELIDELKEDLHHLITHKNAEVIYKGDEFVFNVFKQDLLKLFQNLIINGIKYTEKDVKPVIIIVGKEKLDHYIFSVKDNGIGIAEEHFDKIFEVFQRLHTRDQYSGTGIGLSYCKKVVDLHNGDIWLESKMGEGSTFYFKIPKSYLNGKTQTDITNWRWCKH